MNLEEFNGRNAINGDALPPVRAMMVPDSFPLSDANLKKANVTMTSGSLASSDDISFRYRMLAQSVTEALALVDSYIALFPRVVTKVQDEPLTIADFRFMARIKQVDEALAMLDLRSLKSLKRIVDPLTVVEEFVKFLLLKGIRVVTENILIQTVQTLRKINKLIVTKELTVYDQDRFFSYNIRCNDAFSDLESFVAGINLKPPPGTRVVMEDDIKIYHSFLTKGFERIVVDELLDTADDFPFWVIRFARMLDNMSLTDEALYTKISAIKTILLSESLALDATFILRKLRVMTDNMSVSDANKQRTLATVATATVVPFDAFIRNAFVGGKVYVNITNEGLTLTDGSLQWAYRHKEIIDTLVAADSYNKGRVLMQLVNETSNIVDAFVKIFGPTLYLKISSEGITTVDSTYSVKYAYRRLDEPLTVPDTETDVVWSVRVPSESLVVIDSTTGQPKIISRLQAEALATTDASIAYALRQKILVETLALVDPLTRQQLAARIAAEGLTVSDAQLHNSLRYQVASEAVVLGDSQIKALAKLRTMVESVTVLDGFIELKISRQILTELLGISDEAIPSTVAYVTLSVRNSLGAALPPVLGVDNVIGLGADPGSGLGGN
jgi:hypothetical protein